MQRSPFVVNEYSRIGDWKVDTIIGKGHRQALVSLVERRSGYALLAKVSHKRAELVSDAVKRCLAPVKRIALHTITSDNGKEFSWHKVISKDLDTAFYFAHPYASRERGK